MSGVVCRMSQRGKILDALLWLQHPMQAEADDDVDSPKASLLSVCTCISLQV